MMVEPANSEATAVPEDHGTAAVAARLHDAVHAMAQPLTALSFLLEMARMQPGPEGLHTALNDAIGQCTRAFHALEEVRAAVNELDSSEGWRQ